MEIKERFIHVKDLVKAFYFIAISKRQGKYTMLDLVNQLVY